MKKIFAIFLGWVLVSSCRETEMPKQWIDAEVVEAFCPWTGSECIALPTTRAEFDAYVSSQRARVIETGDSAAARSTIPRPDGLEDYSGAFYVVFPSDPGDDAVRRFVVYYDGGGQIVLVKGNFGYRIP